MGEVAKCVLHLIDNFLKTGAHEFFIVERKNETQHQTVNAFMQRGAHYLQRNLTAENMLLVLQNEVGLKPGDLVVDLTTDTDMFHTVRLAFENGWLYLNTCIENSADERLIHHRNHERMAQLIAEFDHRAAKPACIFDHGMNPGLISSFVKQGLLDIAQIALASGIYPELKTYLAHRDFSAIAECLGLRVLHCSELDDQHGTNIPQDVFVNTWSCPGFLVEAKAPMQMALGTHETAIPGKGSLTERRIFVSNELAYRTRAQSYVPYRKILGMVVPHEEVITLQKFLTRPGYAPTICYVYEINPHTARCFDEGIIDEKNGEVLTPEANKLSGADKVGALFLLARNPLTGEAGTWSYWCGTILETTDPVFSATVIQVAAGVLAAMRWMIANPLGGVRFPEELPHEEMLNSARPFLGEIFSAPVAFTPASTRIEDILISTSGIPAHRLPR